ncbi:MAG: metal-binding protein [Cyanobacteria bacterium RI_101]|nr:metal-binding protein [Cyanobacteria bacterium RI_101]
MGEKERGRLVWNHSTHLDGLIPRLEKLITRPGVGTVTPGVLSRTRSHIPRLQFRISVPIRGGFKVIARQGKSAQEIFILTALSQEELTAYLDNL